jgi:hypothetical protein
VVAARSIEEGEGNQEERGSETRSKDSSNEEGVDMEEEIFPASAVDEEESVAGEDTEEELISKEVGDTKIDQKALGNEESRVEVVA